MTWTVSRRVAVGFAAGLMLVLSVMVLGEFALTSTASAYHSAVHVQQSVQFRALEAADAFNRSNLDFLRDLLQPHPQWLMGLDTTAAAATTLITRLRDSSRAEEREDWDLALGLLARWRLAAAEAAAARRTGRLEAALAVRDQRVAPLRDSLRLVLGRRVEAARKTAADFVVRADTSASRMFAILLVGGIASLALGIVQAVTLTRAITGPLRDTSTVVAASAAEILASATQQASSAAETSAALAETVATVDEVTQTAEQSARWARSVAERAQRAADIGKVGQRAVDQSVTEMSGVKVQVESIAAAIVALAEQAQAIGEITTTVSEIAEQTNMLALNAAVEAARAGDQGRGFAVVASEIRNLAEQSKKATVQVRRILGDIQRATSAAVMTTEQGTKQAAAGSRQVSEAGDTIRSLAEAAAEAAQAASQIVASAGQQAVGMTQIRQAMSSIHEATQQNLSATRQSENAAQALNRLGGRLIALVGGGGAYRGNGNRA